jgi:hypothetical protein
MKSGIGARRGRVLAEFLKKPKGRAQPRLKILRSVKQMMAVNTT